jgi:hypothetical protein
MAPQRQNKNKRWTLDERTGWRYAPCIFVIPTAGWGWCFRLARRHGKRRMLTFCCCFLTLWLLWISQPEAGEGGFRYPKVSEIGGVTGRSHIWPLTDDGQTGSDFGFQCGLMTDGFRWFWIMLCGWWTDAAVPHVVRMLLGKCQLVVIAMICQFQAPGAVIDWMLRGLGTDDWRIIEQ